MDQPTTPVTLACLTSAPCSLGFLAGQPAFLRARGIEVQAISSPGEWLSQFAARQRVAAHAVPMQRRIAPLRDLVSLWRLYRTLRRIRPQVLHARTPKAGLLGMLAGWLAGVPVRIYTLNGLPLMTAHGWKRRLLRCTERIACRLAHWVQAVSLSLGDAAVGEGLCAADKLGVLLGGSSNGVDAEGRFNPDKWGARARRAVRIGFDIPADALVLGYVGRIVRDKGMTELADAWRVLRGQFPDLHLLMLGPFEPQDPVPANVELLFRRDPRIHLAGTVQDAAPYYAAMDLCVLPSYREGLPSAPLEAAAMRLPVVATQIAGCVDAVRDGVTGTLVPPRDAAALAVAIAAYLRDPFLRRNHGEAGRQRVLQEFQPQAIWEALYQQYVRLLEEKGIAVPVPSVPCLATPAEDAPERRAA
jgi:glycosyltransferase involved in cell wall biosynthesis